MYVYEGLGEANDAFGKSFFFNNIVEENHNTSVGIENFYFIKTRLGYHISIYPDIDTLYANLDSNVKMIVNAYEIGLLHSIVWPCHCTSPLTLRQMIRLAWFATRRCFSPVASHFYIFRNRFIGMMSE